MTDASDGCRNFSSRTKAPGLSSISSTGGDSRGQISQMPPPEFEVTAKIGRDRTMPGQTKCWRNILRSEKMCQIEWIWLAHLDWVQIPICLHSLAGSLPGLYNVESPTKVKQRQVDRGLNKTPREFDDQGPTSLSVATLPLHLNESESSQKNFPLAKNTPQNSKEEKICQQ